VARQKISRRLTACKSLGATDAAGPSLRGPWQPKRRRRRFFPYQCQDGLKNGKSYGGALSLLTWRDQIAFARSSYQQAHPKLDIALSEN